MILSIPAILNAQALDSITERLGRADAPWVDGRATAGFQGARVKLNQQIDEASTCARELGDVVLAMLERHPLFISAVLPNMVYPPLFNRYQPGMAFGSHVDGAIRMLPGSPQKLRTDLSATLFLSDPDSYTGGELVIEQEFQQQSFKLKAGDLLVYPAKFRHFVAPVSQGTRLASFFWIQSLVRDDSCREQLFDLDRAIQRLTQTKADEEALVKLTGVYHNLLRIWSEV